MSESNLHVFPLKQLFLQICHFRSVCHHVDEIRLYEDYEDYGDWTQYWTDISLLRVKEPFTGTVNFARLPPVLLNVKGEKVNNAICHKRIYQDFFRW